MRTFVFTQHAARRWLERFSHKGFDVTISGMKRIGRKNGNHLYANNGITMVVNGESVITVYSTKSSYKEFL